MEQSTSPDDRVYNIYQCPRCKSMLWCKVEDIMGICKVDGAPVKESWGKNPLTDPPPDCSDWDKGKATFDKERQNELRQRRDFGDKKPS